MAHNTITVDMVHNFAWYEDRRNALKKVNELKKARHTRLLWRKTRKEQIYIPRHKDCGNLPQQMERKRASLGGSVVNSRNALQGVRRGTASRR